MSAVSYEDNEWGRLLNRSLSERSVHSGGVEWLVELARVESWCKYVEAELVVVLGSQWGDEGKGKLVTQLSSGAKICVRFNGGDNAGHTVVKNEKAVALHLLPCGLLEDKVSLIGTGVVLNLRSLLKELVKLSLDLSTTDIEINNNEIDTSIYDFEELKVLKTNKSKQIFHHYLSLLRISTRTHLLFPAHMESERKNEEQRASKSIGTTGRGIGPCYSDKCARTNIRIGDILEKTTLRKKLEIFASSKSNFDIEAEFKLLQQFKRLLENNIIDAPLYLNNIQNKKGYILAEGANAVMLDIDHGTYPYVTSSGTTRGCIYSGGSINPKLKTFCIGVLKAYCTRVGSGPFPSELDNDMGNLLQKEGGEFGATTGRPRRCGWLDLAQIKYSHLLNNYDALNLTKLDVLDHFDSIGIITGYELAGHIAPTGYFPSTEAEIERVKPIIKYFDGWKSISKVNKLTKYSDLPENAKKLVIFIQNECQIPILWIGTGPKDSDTIVIEVDN